MLWKQNGKKNSKLRKGKKARQECACGLARVAVANATKATTERGEK